MNTTNYIRSDGLDLGQVLLEREYFLSNYTNIANQFITPELWVWGQNGAGQLATNDSINKSTPVTTFSGGSNWKQVSIESNSAGIKNDGTLWIWGDNTYLTLGNNTNSGISRTPITTFAAGNNWRQVSCGNYIVSAIKTDGTLWTWGNNFNGKLGLNALTVVLTPVTTFAGGNNWKQVSSSSHTAAIKTDGTLWVWGENIKSQLGIGATNISRSTPVTTFAGGTNWKQVSVGYYNTAAVKTDGSLWIWGDNTWGQLGINTFFTNDMRCTPVTTFAGGTNWKQVSCKGISVSAVKTDGSLWVWGSNQSGQLGINTSLYNKITPVTTFAGGNDWKRVVTSDQFTTFAIKNNGTLWVWGSNTFNQLALNSTVGGVFTPITTFIGGNNWISIDAGGSSILSIRSYDN